MPAKSAPWAADSVEMRSVAPDWASDPVATMRGCAFTAAAAWAIASAGGNDVMPLPEAAAAPVAGAAVAAPSAISETASAAGTPRPLETRIWLPPMAPPTSCTAVRDPRTPGPRPGRQP